MHNKTHSRLTPARWCSVTSHCSLKENNTDFEMWRMLHCAIVISIEIYWLAVLLKLPAMGQQHQNQNSIRLFSFCSRAHWWKSIKCSYRKDIAYSWLQWKYKHAHTTSNWLLCSGKLQMNLKFCSTNEEWEIGQRNVCGRWADQKSNCSLWMSTWMP